MIVFYHGADLDGKSSGAIVKRRFPQAELAPVDYGDPAPWERVMGHDEVWVLDFSWPREVMERLAGEKKLVWIDHHASAIQDCDGLLLQGLRVVGRAACELTWEYVEGDVDMPRAVRLLGLYDVWEEGHPGWRSTVLPFQMGMRVHDADPERQQDFWDYYLGKNGGDVVQATIQNGEVIVKYEQRRNAEMARALAFDAVLQGVDGLPDLRVIAMVTSLAGSGLFDAVYKPAVHDAMCAMRHDGRLWMVSLYAARDKPAVVDYARAYGGGGHLRACGFRCAGMPVCRVVPPEEV